MLGAVKPFSSPPPPKTQRTTSRITATPKTNWTLDLRSAAMLPSSAHLFTMVADKLNLFMTTVYTEVGHQEARNIFLKYCCRIIAHHSTHLPLKELETATMLLPDALIFI
jgi:hypothetical protein